MKMKDIYKKWWFWVIIAIILLVIGYYQGWFSDTNESAESSIQSNGSKIASSARSNAEGSASSFDKEALISRILSRIDNQPKRVTDKVRIELGKLDVDKLRSINSVVSGATHKQFTDAYVQRKTCSPNESYWNTILDNAGITCCHVCGGIWSF